jgi:O-antigen ligase
MWTSFLFAFCNFFQPGVFWPVLADFKPMQVIAVLALLASLKRPATFSRMDSLRHPAIKWMMAFLLVQVLSVYPTGMYGMVQEFGVWSTYVLFVLVSLRLIGDEGTLRRYIWGMMCGGLWLVGWGLWAWTWHPDLLAANGGRAGAYGMYENHNDYTFVIMQILPFLYVYWRSDKGFLRRTFLFAGLLACVAGVALSLSRGGMIALVLQFLLIVLYTMSRRAKIVLIPIVLLVGAAAVSWQYAARAANQGEGYTAEDAETSRFELWEAGKNMIMRHPVLGVGSRSFGEHSREYAEISHDNLGKNAHNTFIDITATSGLLGIISFLMMIRAAARDLKQPAHGVASSFEESTRKATLIALYTICFRALLDAKAWDWSFYILTTIAAASGAMLKARLEAAKAAKAQPEAPPTTEGSPPEQPATNHLPTWR